MSIEDDLEELAHSTRQSTKPDYLDRKKFTNSKNGAKGAKNSIMRAHRYKNRADINLKKFDKDY